MLTICRTTTKYVSEGVTRVEVSKICIDHDHPNLCDLIAEAIRKMKEIPCDEEDYPEIIIKMFGVEIKEGQSAFALAS